MSHNITTFLLCIISFALGMMTIAISANDTIEIESKTIIEPTKKLIIVNNQVDTIYVYKLK